jgi:hypothetical protein
MRGMTSADDFMRKMQEIQAAREAAIQPLAEILAERRRLQKLLAETDEPYGKAYAGAEAAGWSPDELTRLGLEEPTRRPKGRPRKRPAPTKKTADGAPSASVPPQDDRAEKSVTATQRASGL